MSSRNYPGSAGPNDSDLPEFDPDVLDAIPRAIAEMHHSELLHSIINDALEQEDFVLTPDRIPIDSKLVSSISLRYPHLSPIQIRDYLYQSLKSILVEGREIFRQMKLRRQESDQLELHNQRLEREIRREDFYHRFLRIATISLFLSLTTVFALCGVLLFQKIQNPTYASDRQVQQELSDLKQRLEQRRYQQEQSEFRKYLEQKK